MKITMKIITFSATMFHGDENQRGIHRENHHTQFHDDEFHLRTSSGPPSYIMSAASIGSAHGR
jgi:hypothetical protein